MGVTHPYLSQSSGTPGRPLITGGMMPKAAREQFARLPAGTALVLQGKSDRIRNTSRTERDSES